MIFNRRYYSPFLYWFINFGSGYSFESITRNYKYLIFHYKSIYTKYKGFTNSGGYFNNVNNYKYFICG